LSSDEQTTGEGDSNNASDGLWRMDFKLEVLGADKHSRTVHFRAVPDPRRYDRIEKDGEAYYFDKFLRLLIPEKLILGRAAEQLQGLPLHHLSASIESARQYAGARLSALGNELRGGNYVAPPEAASPHQTIAANSAPRELAFLSVDIAGGSALRRADRDKFDRAYKVLIREFGTVVGQFNGTIYKLTGDGFIAYIDHPSFTSRSDQIIDLGLTLLVVLRKSLNPALTEASLPELKIRIGADSGPICVREIEVPMTGFADLEIASDSLNRAVKIQESADCNEYRIGRGLYELVHVQWLERAAEVAFDGGSVGIPGYRVYRVT
jgi:class 3 adenylate cyclase